MATAVKQNDAVVGGSCRGGFQTRPRSAFTVCEVDPGLVVRTSIAQLMKTIFSQRACGTGAGFKPAPTSFATAICFPSGVCGTLVICDCPARNPGVPGLPSIVRKSGKPDLRRGEVDLLAR